MNYQDIFGQSSPFGQQSAAPPRGADRQAEITITLEEAAEGTTQKITLAQSGSQETLSVKIPPGTKEGQRLRLSGKGEPGISGTSAGNLYLNIHIRPHPVFRPEGENLYLEKSVKYSEALLGTVLEVPTLLEGPRRIRIPPFTQPGAKIRLRGMGLPSINRKNRGDAFVSLQIQVPKKLNKQQKKLIEEMAREGL